jgi:hypothetical protein
VTPLTAPHVPHVPPPERVDAFRDALTALPPDALPEVLARLDATVAVAERSGDVAPLRHLLDSVLMTTRLARNEPYLRAVTEADEADARGEHEGEDVTDFVARMRAKHGG